MPRTTRVGGSASGTRSATRRESMEPIVARSGSAENPRVRARVTYVTRLRRTGGRISLCSTGDVGDERWELQTAAELTDPGEPGQYHGERRGGPEHGESQLDPGGGPAKARQ